MRWLSLILLTALYMVLATAIHELAHVVSAKLLGKHIRNFGFSMRPVPHFFVTVGGELRRREKSIYLLSGVGAVAVLAVILSPLYSANFALRAAIMLQLAIDTNPFYSDVALVVYDWVVDKGKGMSSLASLAPKYYYTGAWYIHLIIWLIFAVQTIKIVQR